MSHKNLLKAIVCKPNQEPEVRELDNKDETYDRLVGGYYHVKDNTPLRGYGVLWDSRRNDRTPNVFGLEGTLVFVRRPVDIFSSLTCNDISKIFELIKLEREGKGKK